ELPAELVHQLRDAALGAHAKRLAELADEVSRHSEPAAAELRKHARDFRYDLILDALAPGATP
ncbi:MAG: hypothetical protein ACAI25_10700, partial [Planctomycetota bacterium]